jgi:hypothetical protein
MAQTFTIVFDTRSAFRRHPRRDWQIHTSVDGRQIDRHVKNRKALRGKRIATMVSSQDGQLVEGELVFAKLVSAPKCPRSLLIASQANHRQRVRSHYKWSRSAGDRTYSAGLLARNREGIHQAKPSASHLTYQCWDSKREWDKVSTYHARWRCVNLSDLEVLSGRQGAEDMALAYRCLQVTN